MSEFKEENPISDGDLLRSILQDSGEWLTVDAISQTRKWIEARPGAFLSATERRIRMAAHKSGGAILSYPGSPGYKLRALASQEEVSTAVAKVRHQASEMQNRAREIETWGQPDVAQGALL